MLYSFSRGYKNRCFFFFLIKAHCKCFINNKFTMTVRWLYSLIFLGLPSSFHLAVINCVSFKICRARERKITVLSEENVLSGFGSNRLFPVKFSSFNSVSLRSASWV